jgi:hypothetical protein
MSTFQWCLHRTLRDLGMCIEVVAKTNANVSSALQLGRTRSHGLQCQ